MSSVEVARQCRGAEYRIKVTNQVTGKPAGLVVDGTPIEGTLVPWAAEGATVNVEVEA